MLLRRCYCTTAAVDRRVPQAHTHTHPFNGPLSGTTQVSRCQKGKINLDFTEARDSEWQWHRLGRMQVCTSLQTDNQASTPPLGFLQAGCPSCSVAEWLACWTQAQKGNSVEAPQARHSAANPPHARPCCGRVMAWTDRLTDTVPFHRPCSISEPGVVLNKKWRARETRPRQRFLNNLRLHTVYMLY